MINTLMTNIISRQQEFAILQAIGLTNKQFVKILQTECLYYIVETAIITLTFGTFAGYILCTVFNQVGTLGTLHFSFPIFASVILLHSTCIYGRSIFFFCDSICEERNISRAY